jgi:hypothetical protein
MCGKHILAAKYQHATIEEAVFSVGSVPSLYNEDLKQLRDRNEGVGRLPSKTIEKKWQEMN